MIGNRVFIATPVFDLDGWLAIDPLPGQLFGDVRRRVNRVPTLDGGAAVNDGGYSEADRDINLTWKRRATEFEDKLAALVSLYPSVLVSTEKGFFRAVPESYSGSSSESSLSLLVTEKIA